MRQPPARRPAVAALPADRVAERLARRSTRRPSRRCRGSRRPASARRPCSAHRAIVDGAMTSAAGGRAGAPARAASISADAASIVSAAAVEAVPARRSRRRATSRAARGRRRGSRGSRLAAVAARALDDRGRGVRGGEASTASGTFERCHGSSVAAESTCHNRARWPGRLLLSRAEPGFTLPGVRAARAATAAGPAPRPARGDSEPGDIVADLHGRGGWVARAAIDRQRRAVQPRDQPADAPARRARPAAARPAPPRRGVHPRSRASPHGETSLRLAIAELFATTLRRPAARTLADRRGRVGGRPSRSACTTAASSAATSSSAPEHQAVEPGADGSRARGARTSARPRSGAGCATASRCPTAATRLIDAILDLHTDRPARRARGDPRAGSRATCGRRRSSRRCGWPSCTPCCPPSRLGVGGARMPTVRIAGGTIRTAGPERWRERNPWLAFEDGYRPGPAFVQRLEERRWVRWRRGSATDLRSLAEGASNAVVRVMTPARARDARR